MSIRNFFKWENSNSGSGGDLCADIESQLKPEGYLVLVRERIEAEPRRQSKSIHGISSLE